MRRAKLLGDRRDVCDAHGIHCAAMRIPLAAVLCLAAACSRSQAPSTSPPPSGAPAGDRGWIERSNQNAQLLLQIDAQFQPESAARQGVTGLDDRIVDLAPGHAQRRRDATRKVLTELEGRLAAEKDPMVAQDLEILIEEAKRQIQGSELNEKLTVPYYELPRLVFGSMRTLLDPQIAAERRPAALVRLRKYLGLEGNQPSIVQLAQAETREGLKKGLLVPARIEVENQLDTSAPMLAGIDQLFKEFNIPNADATLAEMHKQLDGYLAFVRSEVLPKARSDFRLPPEIYAYNLIETGVNIPANELVVLARAAFTQIQGEMQVVATKLAKERGWAANDYRTVIKQLKQEQIPDDKLLAFYKQRLTQLEEIIRKEKLLTLPDRPARIRLGTPGESAQQPAPHMRPPRLIGNTGEQGEFVLPLGMPGKTTQKYDDFNFDAAGWTLTAHEARPGHELQFSRMVETGVSMTRAIFAFNSVNAEGWGLYSEAFMLPYMPLDGQLISLQLRLLRAARAFIDPELQIPGKWTPESAREFLVREVCVSPGFATSEVDRYTFRSPAQATAYFYGYTKMLELRAAAEHQLGERFTPQVFHDTFLAQGLLPPELMRKAVLGALR